MNENEFEYLRNDVISFVKKEKLLVTKNMDYDHSFD